MTVQERLSPGKYRLRVEDYIALADSGAFGDARTELIEGEVFVMSPQYLPHGIVKAELYDQLRDGLRAMASPWRALSEVSVDLSPDSMPAPDILVTSEPRGSGAVSKETVKLLIEVSDTTLREDLGPKLKLYARHGVPEYWVADINERVVHRMWAPENDKFTKRDDHRFGGSIKAAMIRGLLLDTSTL